MGFVVSAGVEYLMGAIHPQVQEQVLRSLRMTFVQMLKEHTTGVAEIEELEVEAARGDDFGSW